MTIRRVDRKSLFEVLPSEIGLSVFQTSLTEQQMQRHRPRLLLQRFLPLVPLAVRSGAFALGSGFFSGDPIQLARNPLLHDFIGKALLEMPLF